MADIVKSPLPKILFPLMDLILVALTRVVCFAAKSVVKLVTCACVIVGISVAIKSAPAVTNPFAS